MSTVIMTLCCIYNDTHILLGMKKRGFGEGRWNGFGGKVHEGETIKESAIRELGEETGIKAEKLEEKGIITFEFKNDPKKLEVHIFHVEKYSGEPVETEEMKPKWFKHDEIPFDSMWPDDPYWIPLLLDGKKFGGKTMFKDQNTILENNIKEIN